VAGVGDLYIDGQGSKDFVVDKFPDLRWETVEEGRLLLRLIGHKRCIRQRERSLSRVQRPSVTSQVICEPIMFQLDVAYRFCHVARNKESLKPCLQTSR
jgi:hypothetical protein